MVRSARTLRSMAALVSVVVERRARVHASGWAAGVGGRALYLSGGWPDLSVARHATRSAASAGHLAELRRLRVKSFPAFAHGRVPDVRYSLLAFARLSRRPQVAAHR